MSTTEAAQNPVREIVRNLASAIVDDAGRRAEDAETIDFLHGKVKRVEEALALNSGGGAYA